MEELLTNLRGHDICLPQNEMDEARYGDYFRQRYACTQLLEREREKQEQMDNCPTVEMPGRYAQECRVDSTACR